MAVALALAPASAQGVREKGAADEARKGWTAIQEGRAGDAAEAFALALRVEPRNPSLHVGNGLAAYLLGRMDEARRSLSRALALAPATTTASILLGDILYRTNELDAAVRVYEAARVHAPDDERLAARLDDARREAAVQSTFFQAQGAHFTVLFEGPADEALARQALEVLEGAYWRVGTSLLVFPSDTIPVVLYTEQQFRDVTRTPAWAAAAYDGRIRVPVRGALADPAELERVLAHELTHALIRSVAPRGVPVWLNEGLAVYFEATGAEWVTAELARTPERVPFARLAESFDGLSDAQARLAYAQSAAAVRTLIDTAGTFAVMAIVQDLAAGEALAETFERHVPMPFAEFAERVVPAR